MRNFSLLTRKETFWLNFGHITRAGAEDPASDRLSIPARFRLEPSWTRGRDSAQRYKYRAGLEPGRGSRNDVASTSTATCFPRDLSCLFARRASHLSLTLPRRAFDTLQPSFSMLADGSLEEQKTARKGPTLLTRSTDGVARHVDG